MSKMRVLATILSVALPSSVVAQPTQSGAPTAQAAPAPSPAEIVAAAPADAWTAIKADDLLVMELAPYPDGRARQVLIQLVPAPFSETWVANIRTLARKGWWDGLSVNRVQDNYVAQWGDADGEDAAKARPLPTGLRPTGSAAYRTPFWCGGHLCAPLTRPWLAHGSMVDLHGDPYARESGFWRGWPIAGDREGFAWPVHCYGMVGVGRGMDPDAGTGAELYAVIGHAPRHLDRNIALVGRVIAGIEHLSSLPRGTGALGFYETAAERVPIRAIRLASDLTDRTGLSWTVMDTAHPAFAAYATARANRRDPFFIVPAGGADLCNVPVPVRPAP